MINQLPTVLPKMPTAPKNSLPAGSCDAHTHVFGPYERFPLVLQSAYPPPEASIERHLGMLNTVGAQYAVIVQPGPYYTDANCLTAALKESKGRLRGIAIQTPDATDNLLTELSAAGVRGLRFVDVFTSTGGRSVGSVSVNELPMLAPRMRALGWHAEMWADLEHHLTVLPELTKLGVPLVLDHMAGFDVVKGVEDPLFQTLLAYLRNGEVYVKLSLCRRAATYPNYEELRPFHEALVAANSDNLLWGSDWPYVAMGDSAPDVGVMLNRLDDWIGDTTVHRKILVNNPARIYGL